MRERERETETETETENNRLFLYCDYPPSWTTLTQIIRDDEVRHSIPNISDSSEPSNPGTAFKNKSISCPHRCLRGGKLERKVKGLCEGQNIMSISKSGTLYQVYLVWEHLWHGVKVHPLGNDVEPKEVSVHAHSSHCLHLIVALIPAYMYNVLISCDKSNHYF